MTEKVHRSTLSPQAKTGVAVTLSPACFDFPVQLHGFRKSFALPVTISTDRQPVVKVVQRLAEFQKAQAGFRPFVQPLLQQFLFLKICLSLIYSGEVAEISPKNSGKFISLIFSRRG